MTAVWGAPCNAVHHQHYSTADKSRPGPTHAQHWQRSWAARDSHHRCRTQAAAVSLPELETACSAWKKAPPSEKFGYTADVLSAMVSLKESGKLQKWGKAAEDLNRRNVMMGELRMVGIKDPEVIGKASVRNDALFLITVVLTTSAIAVPAQLLPGDWGFFVPYLVGGISIAVLAVGSVAPGLLQFAIDRFSLVFPDYRERTTRHEAAHFLTGYLLGFPIANYSLMIGKEHTEFCEGKTQRKMYGRNFSDEEVNEFSVLAMAGAASEAMRFDEVIGQTADLIDLQKILKCSKNRLSDREQQNMTRWAVYQACNLLRKYKAEYEALQAAMSSGASVPDCVAAIEKC